MTYSGPHQRIPPQYMLAISTGRIQDLNNTPSALTANRAHYVPVLLDHPIVVDKVRWLNGGTINGNVDVGIYDADGTRIVSSGSTAHSGASVIQEVDITDTYLSAGMYYAAWSQSSGTATFYTFSDQGLAEWGRLHGLLQESSAFPLPSTMTPSVWTSQVWNAIAWVTKIPGS